MFKAPFRAAGAALAAFAISGVSAVGVMAQTAPSAAITIKMSDTRLGSIMTDGKGMSLYMFAPDTRNVSNCEGACLTQWPPVMLPASATLADVKLEGSNLRRSLLGVAMRADGSRHVTYNGFPLYYWFRDGKPGDVAGQWVNNIWWVLNDQGVPNTAR